MEKSAKAGREMQVFGSEILPVYVLFLFVFSLSISRVFVSKCLFQFWYKKGLQHIQGSSRLQRCLAVIVRNAWGQYKMKEAAGEYQSCAWDGRGPA